MLGGGDGIRRYRALLWALYFMLIALGDRPSFMDGWHDQLREHLDEAGAPERSAQAAIEDRRLRRVK